MDNNELDGHELEANGDFGRGNDFTRVSSLARLRNLEKDVTNKGTSWNDRTSKRNQTNTDTNNKDLRFMDEEGTDRNQAKTVKAKSLGIASGRTAKEMRMETDALKVGPDPVVSP